MEQRYGGILNGGFRAWRYPAGNLCPSLVMVLGLQFSKKKKSEWRWMWNVIVSSLISRILDIDWRKKVDYFYHYDDLLTFMSVGWFSCSSNSALRQGTSHAEQNDEKLLSQMLAFRSESSVWYTWEYILVTKLHILVSEVPLKGHMHCLFRGKKIESSLREQMQTHRTSGLTFFFFLPVANGTTWVRGEKLQYCQFCSEFFPIASSV